MPVLLDLPQQAYARVGPLGRAKHISWMTECFYPNFPWGGGSWKTIPDTKEKWTNDLQLEKALFNKASRVFLRTDSQGLESPDEEAVITLC